MDKNQYIETNVNKLFIALVPKLCIGGALIFLLLSTLDYVSTPENFRTFLVYRITISSLLLLIWLAIHIYKFHSILLYQFLLYISVLGASLTIELMILKTGGHTSSYYVGMSIVGIWVISFIPAKFILSLILMFTVYGTYLFPIVAMETIADYRTFFTANAFLIALLSSSLVLRYINYTSLVNELGLMYDLETYKNHLETLVNERTTELSDSVVRLQEEIAARKQIERVVERAASEWRAAMDASQDIICLLDLKRHVLRANESFYATTGKTPGTAVGRHIREIIHPQGEPAPCPLCQAQEEKRDAIVIMEADHPDNFTGRPVEINVRIIRDEQGQPLSMLMTLHDLTRDRKAQEEKAKLEAQLHQAQKLEAVGQLAGGIAHDFNNMLTVIIGYANLLSLRIEQDNSSKPFVEQILSTAEKSATLTRQLLAFSRKQICSPKQIDLNSLILGLKNFLQRVIGEDIDFSTRLAGAEVTVVADPGQMEQVLMNLCTNARDAMPDGGSLSVETGTAYLDDNHAAVHRLGKPGMYALMTVTDSGTGMDEKTIEKIFEPFFTTKEVGKGTGLGLSIVYGIVRQHNGHITVFSEPGKGTVFTIYLPLVAAAAEVTIKSKATGLTRGTETILVTEDNEPARTLTRTVLEEFGYSVIEAVDGEDGVTKFKDNRDTIRLVMLDVVMPKKSGKEACQEIKSICPTVKILFTSGYTADILKQKDIFDKGADFIPKPATPYELLTKIREMLDKKAESDHRDSMMTAL